jgi:hypothetical protein
MADSDELLRKTDALLGRYRGAPRGDEQSDFPVLTEVVDNDTGAGLEARQGGGNDSAASHGAHTAINETDVAEQLKARLDVVAASLADELHERLESRMQAALDEIGSELRALVDTSVAAALARALADLEQTRNSDTDSL